MGHGIPEGELPHVKEKFYKGSSKNRGSGIGLAVCDEIVTRSRRHADDRQRPRRRYAGLGAPAVRAGERQLNSYFILTEVTI